MLKTALAGLSCLVLLAVAYLTLSVLILHPTRVNYPAWFTLAAVIVAQMTATLVAIASAGRRWAVLRWATLAGALVGASIGAWMVRETLTSAHFEGYALVLGSMLVLQAAVTIGVFFRPSPLKRV